MQGLYISISALHRRLVQKCNVTLKKLEKLPAVRNSDADVKLRKEKFEEREAMRNLDFGKNRVFVTRSRF